jgi:hypothetical protein
MRTRNSILAAVAVIGLGAALLIFRDPHVSPPSHIPSRALIGMSMLFGAMVYAREFV